MEEIKEKECYMNQQDDEYSCLYECSNCKEEFFWGEEPEDIKESNVNYCPFCGCKIKEVVYIEDEENEE